MPAHDASASASAGLSPALTETIAGLTAGSIATLLVHPLDIARTRLQLSRFVSPSSPSTPGTPRITTISILRDVVRTATTTTPGSQTTLIAALYRGLTPNLLGNATAWSSFFLLKSRIEHMLARLKTAQPHHQHQHPEGRRGVLGPPDYFLASGLAGAGVQVLTNPIWVLKTRMLAADRGARGAYPSSMLAGAARVWREEGWRGFYRGLGVSLAGVSHGAVQFAVYEPAKRVYFSRRQEQGRGRSGDGVQGRGRVEGEGKLSNQATVVLSGVSKLVAGAATYPYQVVRSRLQNYDAEARFGRGVGEVVRRTWREEGWRGFYRGIGPGVVRVLPATWVTFLVYENVRFYLPRWAG